MRMSTEGRMNLHQREKLVMKFYDDGGRPGVGNCSFGFHWSSLPFPAPLLIRRPARSCPWALR